MSDTKTHEFTVSRQIRGAADDIYDVWLDPKSPGGIWFGVERCILEPATPVVDGLFHHSVKHEGRSWAHYGRFLRLDRGKAIEFTWVSEPTKGMESIVSVTLVPRDGGTEVTLRHSNLPDDEQGRQHKEGWTWYLKALGERFEKVTA